MAGVQQMQVDNQNEVAIVDASETLLRDSKYKHCGVSIDLYQFRYDPTRTWNYGHIFHANKEEDLSFEGGIAGQIDALDPSNKRDAAFLVHGEDMQQDVEEMVRRNLRHNGILRTYGVGYNTQISKVVSGYHAPTRTFADWLQVQALKPKSTSIPISLPFEVQKLIWTGYQAMEMIWARGYTSDFLDDPGSYLMDGNTIKIHPLRIRDRTNREEDQLPVRRAFGNMILNHIYPIWKDEEIKDFIFLLGLHKAGVGAILGAPVLLLPPRRELMYHDFANAELLHHQWNWLRANANIRGGWKIVASNEDLALKSIIDYQAKGVGFQPNLKGALDFASVVTAHYQQHVKDNTQVLQGGVEKKNRVDWLLKKVLLRLLSRRYNADYV